jgi:hypothetical protein
MTGCKVLAPVIKIEIASDTGGILGADAVDLTALYKQWKDDGAFGLDDQGQPTKAGEMFAQFVLRMGIYVFVFRAASKKVGRVQTWMSRRIT